MHTKKLEVMLNTSLRLTNVTPWLVKDDRRCETKVSPLLLKLARDTLNKAAISENPAVAHLQDLHQDRPPLRMIVRHVMAAMQKEQMN